MKVNEFYEFSLKYYINAVKTDSDLVPVIVYGDFGIGKSYIVKQLAVNVAKQLELEFLDIDEVSDEKIHSNVLLFKDIRLYEEDSNELRGYPVVHNSYFHYIPNRTFYWFSKNLHNILFLDELTMAPEDTKKVAFKLLRDRKIGDTVLSKYTWVIAAGNPPESNALASYLPMPVHNRAIVLELKPDLTEFVELPFIHERVKLYLLMFKTDLTPIVENETENIARPRTWEYISTLLNLYESHNIYLSEEVFQGLLGKKIGSKFWKFYTLKIPTMQEIISDPSIYDKLPDEGKFIVGYLILKALDEESIQITDNLKRVLISMLGFHREYTIALFRYLKFPVKILYKIVKEVPEYQSFVKQLSELKA